MKRWLYIPLTGLMAFYMADVGWRWTGFAEQTVAGTANAPFQYRVLFAHYFVAASGALNEWLAAWLFAFVILALFAALMDAWLRLWTGEERAALWTLLGLLLVMGWIWFLPEGAPWSLLEGLFWLAALLLLHSGRTGWLFPLVAVATLNRETTVFIPLLALLVTRRWGLAIGLGVVWAAVYGALRYVYAGAPLEHTLAFIWQANTQSYRLAWFLVGLPFVAWLPVLAVRGYRGAPLFLRRAAWVALPYLAAIAVFGVWREFRLFIPLLPLAVPLATRVTHDH